VSGSTLYGGTERQRSLWALVWPAGDDLRGRLQALRQLGYGRDPDDVEAVRLALFVAHGWGSQPPGQGRHGSGGRRG